MSGTEKSIGQEVAERFERTGFKGAYVELEKLASIIDKIVRERGEQSFYCECGHSKFQHAHYEDHDECIGEECECDEFRPTKTNATLERGETQTITERERVAHKMGYDLAKRELERVEADTKRLDWLSRNWYRLAEDISKGRIRFFTDEENCLREAIDAATVSRENKNPCLCGADRGEVK